MRAKGGGSGRARGWEALCVVIALVAGGASAPAAEEGTAGGFALSISTEKPVYKVGEPIGITLRLVNRTKEEVTLEFSDAQRYDLVIRDTAEKEVWRWSRDHAFAQVLGSETLGAARPQLEYRAQFGGPLAPGLYPIEGSVLARGHRLSATLTVLVK